MNMPHGNCPRCGAMLIENARFCNRCGFEAVPMAGQPFVPAGQAYNYHSAGMGGHAPAKPINKKIIIITITAAVAVLAALAVIVIMNISSPEPDRPLTAAEMLDLGEKYLLDLNYEQALVQFLGVIEIEPMNPRGYIGAAEAYIGLGNFEGAVVVLRDGFAQLPDEPSFLVPSIGIYENIIGSDPMNQGAYIGLARVRLALGEELEAIEVLLTGRDAMPDNAEISDMLSELLEEASLFEIVTIYDTVFHAPNGEEIGVVTCQLPVFRSGYRYAEKFNEIIGGSMTPLSHEETQSIYQETLDEAIEFAQMLEAQGSEFAYAYGDGGGFYSETMGRLTYRAGAYVSFSIDSGMWYPGGMRPAHLAYGHTFNLATGEMLAMQDVLFVDENTVGTALADAFLAQYPDDAPSGDWHRPEGMNANTDYDMLVEASTLESPFWLSEDGVNIYYERYSFTFGAYGDRLLTIPFSRLDLVRPPFALIAGSWQEAYSALLESQEFGIEISAERFSYSAQVAIADVIGDETPELLFVSMTSHEGTADGVDAASLFVYSYDQSGLSLLMERNVLAMVGGWTTYAIFTADDELWFFRSLGSDYQEGSYARLTYQDGELIESGRLSFLYDEHYIYGGDAFTLEGQDISADEFSRLEETLLASVDTLFLGWLPDVSPQGMTYGEAMAFLSEAR